MIEKKKIFIIAGEVSGDMHAGYLCSELYSNYGKQSLEITGIGGKNMESAGVNIVNNIVDKAVIGVVDAVKNVKPLLKLFSQIKTYLKTDRPDLLILVDYSGFNLKIAHVAHDLGIKTVYYIAPQVWAWRKYRLKEIRKYVDEVIAVFPFEVEMYQKNEIPVAFFGHPLVDIVSPKLTTDEIMKRYDINSNSKVITLLPGSRKKEILNLLPVMLKVVKKLRTAIPDLRVIINQVATGKSQYDELAKEMKSLNVFCEDEYNYDSVSISDFVMVASGTATLETALLGVPMAVMYKTSKINEYLAKVFLEIDNIALANIVSGSRVVPEFVQENVSVEKIYPAAIEILKNEELNKELRLKLKQGVKKLGKKGVVKKIASYLIEKIEN